MCNIIIMQAQSKYKRIPISHSTWEQLSLLKKPGETFDQLISDLVSDRYKQDIIRHVRDINEKGDFISLDDAEIAWELNES